MTVSYFYHGTTNSATIEWNGYTLRFNLNDVSEGQLFDSDLLEAAFKSINLKEVKIYGNIEYESEAEVATYPPTSPKPVRFLANRILVNDTALIHRQLGNFCNDLMLCSDTIRLEEEADKLVDTELVERVINNLKATTINDMRRIILEIFHILQARPDVEWSYGMQRVVGKRVANIAKALLIGGD